jgi:hypothetical protein
VIVEALLLLYLVLESIKSHLLQQGAHLIMSGERKKEKTRTITMTMKYGQQQEERLHEISNKTGNLKVNAIANEEGEGEASGAIVDGSFCF